MASYCTCAPLLIVTDCGWGQIASSWYTQYSLSQWGCKHQMAHFLTYYLWLRREKHVEYFKPKSCTLDILFPFFSDLSVSLSVHASPLNSQKDYFCSSTACIVEVSGMQAFPIILKELACQLDMLIHFNMSFQEESSNTRLRDLRPFKAPDIMGFVYQGKVLLHESEGTAALLFSFTSLYPDWKAK